MVTGKTAYGQIGIKASGLIRLTIIDVHLINTCGHGFIVIAEGKFAESGKTSRPHPNLKLFVLGKVWNGIFIVVSIWVASLPVGRRGDLIIRVLGLAVQSGVGRPGNALVGHSILLARLASGRVHGDGRIESVIEDRICDQAARIICLAFVVEFQRVT